MAHQQNGSVHVLSPDDSLTRASAKETQSLNQRLLDVSFSGGPVQCDPPTCEYMAKTLQFAGTMGLDESYQVCAFRPPFVPEAADLGPD